MTCKNNTTITLQHQRQSFTRSDDTFTDNHHVILSPSFISILSLTNTMVTYTLLGRFIPLVHGPSTNTLYSLSELMPPHFSQRSFKFTFNIIQFKFL